MLAKTTATGIVIKLGGAGGLQCNQPLYSGVPCEGIKHILVG